MLNGKNALTVTQVNRYMKMVTDAQGPLQDLWVRGELSNFTNHYKTGHFYFTVKDEECSLKGVMFRSDALKVRFAPENGMKVLLHGRITVFPRDGVYQLYADEMQPDGEGALALAFEQLKKKLEAEGLFAEERKRPLPRFPSSVGVITSPTGAAVRDIINITGRRFPSAVLRVYPALVQGDAAVPSLIAGLEFFNRTLPCDVIVIGRGGGSLEDLWAFNDERLARAVAASRIPVISAVGHETDFTICDFVSDRRAPTPSAAAELAVPDRAELLQTLKATGNRLDRSLVRSVEIRRKAVKDLASRRVFVSCRSILDDRRMELSELALRLDRETRRNLSDQRTRVSRTVSLLDALSPLRVIGRGYGAVMKEGKVLNGAETVCPGDGLTVRMRNGEIDCTVIEVRGLNADETKKTEEP